jgi:hypothetical protein
VSVGRLLTLGYGSFGGVHFVPTLGLGVGAAVVVPNVVGETLAQAIIDITALGLIESDTNAYSDSVAVGLVISQSPSGGSNVAPGSNVAIVISLGPQSTIDTHDGGTYKDFERLKRQAKLYEQGREQRDIESGAISASAIATEMREEIVSDEPKPIQKQTIPRRPILRLKAQRLALDDDEVIAAYLLDEQRYSEMLIEHAEKLVKAIGKLH